MKNLKNPTGQTARWLQELGTYDLKVIHRAGRSHANADALSRFPCKSCSNQQRITLEDHTKYQAGIFPSNVEQAEDNILIGGDVVRVTTRNHRNGERCFVSPVTLEGWTVENIRQKQLADKIIGPIKVFKEENSELTTLG